MEYMGIRYKEEINSLLNEEAVVRSIKSQRLNGLGHGERMGQNEVQC
jgi:hypothetical protein